MEIFQKILASKNIYMNYDFEIYILLTGSKKNTKTMRAEKK